MAAYIYEFLYRGQASGSGKQPSWHVVLAEEVTAMGETRLVTKGPMTPAEASALGHDLPDILSAINTEAMADRDSARAALAEAEKQRDEVQIAHDAVKAERDTARADRDTFKAQRDAARTLLPKDEQRAEQAVRRG